MVMNDDFFDKADREFFRDFDKELTNIKPKKIIRFGIGLWLFWVLCVLGFWGTVIYVALHFLTKMW
jgi:hypothetical protein